MEYLDENKKRFIPKESTFMRQEDRDLEWQNEGHEGITEDFSDMKTPQEVEDENIIIKIIKKLV